MEKITEKIQEEAWAKISPYFEWHRLIIFIAMNFLFSSGFLDVVLNSFETKNLSDIGQIVSETLNQLKIKVVFYTFLASFCFTPWLSSKLNWLFLKQFQFKLARPLREKLEKFSKQLTQKKLVPEAFLRRKFELEKKAIRKFRVLKMLCELWLILIFLAYIEYELNSILNIFLLTALSFLGFWGLSQSLMVTFLRDIVPAQIIRKLHQF